MSAMMHAILRWLGVEPPTVPEELEEERARYQRRIAEVLDKAEAAQSSATHATTTLRQIEMKQSLAAVEEARGRPYGRRRSDR